MPNDLIANPKYNANLPVSGSNQPYVFATPETAVVNPQTGQTAISAASLVPATPIELPKTPIDTSGSAGILAGGQSMADMLTQQMATRAAEVKTEAEARAKEQPDILTQLLKSSEAPPDLAKTYESVYGVGPTQAEITQKEQDVIAKETAVKSAQNELNMLNAQLRDITASAQAQSLQLEKQISGGQFLTAGSMDFLSRQQQEVNRQAAIASLPLQGQTLMAQAKILSAQGDVDTAQKVLTQAQAKFDKVFELRVQDATNQYNYRKDLIDKVYDYATKKEQAKLDAQKIENANAFTLMTNNLNNAQQLSRDAMANGQGDIAAKITQLDPKSPTFTSDLAALQAKIKITDPNVQAMMDEFKDAGILPTDDLATASAKLKNSKIYQDKVRGPVGPQPPSSYQEWTLAGKPGTYADWVAKISGGDTERLSKVDRFLQGTTGPDELVSAESYLQARQMWSQMKGSGADFKIYYPPEKLMRKEEIDRLYKLYPTIFKAPTGGTTSNEDLIE